MNHPVSLEPDWLAVLRVATQATSQATVAKEIGYSAAVISQVLKGSYVGNTTKVQQAVEGALMGLTVDCPAIGELRRDRCLEFQRQPFACTNPLRVQLSRTCPTCPNKRGVHDATKETL